MSGSKMKIALMSDIHLEFGTYRPRNEEGADVLILAGDITTRDFYPEFFQQAGEEFPHVLYVLGNHEYYSQRFEEVEGIFRKYLPSNVHLLNREFFTLEDVLFLGATLWTPLRNNPIVKQRITDKMSDFRIIRYGSGKFTADAHIAEHQKDMAFLSSSMQKGSKIVVITHHTPTMGSCSEHYRDEHIVNAAFHNDLEEFILDHPQIRVWCHGHTHHACDYMVGSTRVLCKPRGYAGYEHTIGYKPIYFNI